MKKFNIAQSNNNLFGASLTPGCIFGEYTQIRKKSSTAVKLVWIVRDYSHYAEYIDVEILSRDGKRWNTYELPLADKTRRAYNGLYGVICGYIDKFIDRLPENLKAQECVYGLEKIVPKERKAQCLEKSVYEGHYSPYAFNGNYGNDAHAYDTGVTPTGKTEWNGYRDISNCNSQSGYSHEYDNRKRPNTTIHTEYIKKDIIPTFKPEELYCINRHGWDVRDCYSEYDKMGNLMIYNKNGEYDNVYECLRK